MKKFSILLTLIMIVNIMSIGIGTISVSAAGSVDSELVMVNHLGESTPTPTGGLWTVSGAVVHDALIPNTTEKAIKFSPTTTTAVTYIKTANYYGNFKYEFDMYLEENLLCYSQLSTYEPTTHKYYPIPVKFMPDGKLIFDSTTITSTTTGQVIGYYSTGVKYKFELIFDGINKAYKVRIKEGVLSQTAGGTAIAVDPSTQYSYSLNANFANFGSLRFGASLSVAGTAKNAYVDNIKLNAMPLTMTYNANIIPSTTDLPIVLNQFMENSTLGNIVVKKNNTPLTISTDYTIVYGLTNTITTSSTPVFSTNPTIKLTNPAQVGDTYRVEFANVTDTFGYTAATAGSGRTFSALDVATFTVFDSSLTDTSISGITGYTNLVIDNSAGTISNLVKGTKMSDILGNIVTTVTNATVKLLDKNDVDITSNAANIYLFNGEKIKVTAKDGLTTKIYTLNTIDDAKVINFNGANGDKVGYGDTVSAFNNAFKSTGDLPVGSFPISSMYYTANTTKDTNYGMGSIYGAKTDKSAMIKYENFTIGASNVSTYFNSTATINANKVYAINFSILGTKASSKIDVFLRAGDQNGKTLPTALVAFESITKKINVLGTEIGNYQAGVWYNFSYIVDTNNKIIKGFINGEAVNAEISYSTLDPIVPTALSTQFKLFAPQNYLNYTAAMYVDNLSIYEVARYDIPVLPNQFDFVPALNIGTFNNKEATLNITSNVNNIKASDITNSITNLSNGYTAKVYNNDETIALSGDDTLNWAVADGNQFKLVLKNGDFVKSYAVITGGNSFVGGDGGSKLAVGVNTLTLPEYRTNGIYALGIYKLDKLVAINFSDLSLGNRTLSYTILEGEDPIEYEFRAFIFESLDNLKPTINKIIIN